MIPWSLLQASNGLPSFQHEVAMMYLSGDGVPKDRELALHWLRAAVTNNYKISAAKLRELTNAIP
jgi:TPR repeat protein